MFKQKNKSYFYGEHFEALGDVWDAIYGNAVNFAKNYIEKSILEGCVYLTQKIKGKHIFSILYPIDTKQTDKTELFTFQNLDTEPVQILNYIEDNKKSKTHITTCPVLKGAKNKLQFKEAYTWGNGVEGEFAAKSLTANELILNFFDPFYSFDKKYHYKEDTVQEIYLSAAALVAQELKERHDVYTEGAPYELYLKKFLEENPDKTGADFEPPVIEMRAEHFRMYAPHNTTSVVEIAGLIEDIEYIEALGKKFAVLKVNLEHREDNEYLYINVYIGEHILEKYTPKIGKGIIANIFLMGYCDPKQHQLPQKN